MIELLASLIVLVSSPKTQKVNVKLAQDVLATSVLIRAKEVYTDPETNKEMKGLVGCSGTFISPIKVLTAAHCFDMPVLNIWVRGYNEQSYNARLIKVNRDMDLALLEIQTPIPHRFVHIGPVPKIGDQVLSVGSPYGLEFLVSEGICSAFLTPNKRLKGFHMVHTGMINSGSSGGGAFNSKGELIGVNVMTVGGLFGWAGISIAVDLSQIQLFLMGESL